MKAETQIKHKEEMGDDLKFIDFHQLQIENKKHVKDIDERNKKLLALKLNSGKTVQTLNSLKKKLQDAIRLQEMIAKDMQVKKQKFERNKEDITRAKKEIEKIIMNNRTQAGMQQEMADMPDPLMYVKQKNLAVERKVSCKNWERKIEIAEIAAKKARQILKDAGEHITLPRKPYSDHN